MFFCSLIRRMALALVAVTLAASSSFGADRIRFAVGPFQPTAGDTRKAYEPFFQYLARSLGL